MKKIHVLFALVVGVCGLEASAYQVVVEERAVEVEGVSYYSTPRSEVSSCSYAVVKGTTNQGAEEIVVYLNSDEDSNVNAAVRLSPKHLPLQEGTIVSRNGLTVRYEDGVLTQIKKQTDEGIFNNDYKILSLEVSPDLMRISKGYTKSAVKGLIREKLLG